MSIQDELSAVLAAYKTNLEESQVQSDTDPYYQGRVSAYKQVIRNLEDILANN